MQFIVRFDRPADSTGPDAVVLTAERYGESYHEGLLAAYVFYDAEDREVARVRAARVVYIALAGSATEPGPPSLEPPQSAAQPPAAGETETD